MNIWHSAILGIIEGLTEFLPISSTFHLIVSSRLLGLASTDFLKLFEVFIQSGAIAALIFVYAKTLLTDKQLFMRVATAFIPTAVVGAVLYKIIKSIFFETGWLMLGMFILVGLLFLFIEWYLRSHKIALNKVCHDLSTKEAVVIGLAQACSVIPGVSRAGSVIVAMMAMGYRRDEAAKFTFLLSLPTIFAASAMDMYQSRELLSSVSNSWMLLGFGFVTALIVAYFVMQWFTKYLASHTLAIFGWYRLVVTALLIVFKVLP